MSAILEYAKKKAADFTKEAGLMDLLAKNKDAIGAAAGVLGVAGGMSSFATAMYNKLKRDTQRRNVYESLASDPEFANIDKAKLLEWYATIDNYAPSVTLDKGSCKEFLRQFAMFGRVDMQSVKMLTEIEHNATGARKDAITLPKWF